MTTNPQLTPAKVLAVDDMETNLKLLNLVLKKPEYQITKAKDGFEALEALRHESFDVVLLDVVMPGIDGFETCHRIREELGLKLLPIIMVTSMCSPDDVVKGMEVGADDYITKPYNTVELIARVKAAIERKRLTDLLDDAEAVLFTLARMVEARDEGTSDHCDRLSYASVVFGKELGLKPVDLEALRRGGVLHDIGKLGIPDNILLKKDPLNEEEWAIMKQHTTIGATLCKPLRTMKNTAEIVCHHHEKFDGTGYPGGLKGEEIPFLARVFQIVDVYDALHHDRTYKPAFPLPQVIEIMEAETAKGYWDPHLMSIFLDILRTRPDILKLPAKPSLDRSATIFADIHRSGVMDWYTKA